ncbi:MAG: glycosyltransferase family 4 protein [Phycisphaeraceae bacterium]
MPPTVIGFYIETGSSITGGPRVAYNLMKALDRGRYRPVAITNTEGELAQWLRDAGVTVHIIAQPKRIGEDDGGTLKGGRLGQLLAALDLYTFNRKAARVLEAEGAELLWVRNVKGVLLTGLAARKLKIPLIWDIGMEKPSRGMMRRLHNLAFKTSAKVVTEGSFVAPSIFDEDQLARFGGKIVVNTPALAPDRVEVVRRGHMTPADQDGRFRVLSVATVNDRKNQMMLVRAVAQLKDRYPRVHVRIAGPATDERYEQDLKAYIAEHGLGGHVKLLGWRSDIPELLHGSDLFTLTSRVEGIPQSILEAMYARVPVVATAAGGVPDVVEDGVTGRLIAIDDEATYIDALADCLAHPEKLERYAEAAYQKACDTITTAQWYQRYETIFDQLLGKGAGVS